MSHIEMSRVAYRKESCHIMNESCHTCAGWSHGLLACCTFDDDPIHPRPDLPRDLLQGNNLCV